MSHAAENVVLLRFKPDATPAERLYEFAGYAEKYPEKFSKMILIYAEEDRPTGKCDAVEEVRFNEFGCPTVRDVVGLLAKVSYLYQRDANS